MKLFRELTTGQNVIMGRKTFESTGILKNRNNIIATGGNLDKIFEEYDNGYIIGGLEIINYTLKHYPERVKIRLHILNLECRPGTHNLYINPDEWNVEIERWYIN